MNQFKNFMIILTAISFIWGCTSKKHDKDIKVFVEINYGSKIEKTALNIAENKDLTVLEAIQHIAVVETHPVDKYVFVTSINGVKGERGITAWYYEVNGKPTGTLAINKMLKNGDRVAWLYKKDVCSQSVDNKVK
jgi:hypothetical protein